MSALNDVCDMLDTYGGRDKVMFFSYLIPMVFKCDCFLPIILAQLLINLMVLLSWKSLYDLLLTRNFRQKNKLVLA